MATYSYTGSVQTYTVAAAGELTIKAYGAQGGAGSMSTGGKGAEAYGTVSVTAGETVEIVVGGQGGNERLAGGGGGGTFVYYANGAWLEVAGGGGGGGYNNDGQVGASEKGNAQGGEGNGYGAGGGGAGVNSAGTSANYGYSGVGGTNAANQWGGGLGGAQFGTPLGGTGGFGGGGGGGSNSGGGGGGGYSGGKGGYGGGNTYSGYGGGSLATGANSGTLAGVESGNGEVILSFTATCFASGTLIRTTQGDVAVESLSPGDLVVTASGEARAITWLGHRRIDFRRHPDPRRALPVRIAAHAFGENLPARDLVVSPGHSVCVDGDKLIPASSLVNGATVAQIEVAEVTYWHVELDSHDVLISENLPTESYLDAGNRGFFTNSGVTALHASPDAEARANLPWRHPFHETGAVVEAARAQLRQQAEALGWRLASATGLHLIVDGARIEPETNGLTATFALPPECGDVWLVAGAVRPCDVAASADQRDLGVAVRRLKLDDAEIALDDRRLRGFHPAEPGWRWTTPRACLPARLVGAHGARTLTLDLAAAPLPRWRQHAA